MAPVCWCCRFLVVLVIRGWDFIFLGWRWRHEPQPISNQPAKLGRPHRARRYRPGAPPFSSPVCWSCRYTEGFMIRRCPPSSLGGAGSTNPKLRFTHRAGRHRPREPPFLSPICGSCRCVEGFAIWGGTMPFPGGADSKNPRLGLTHYTGR